MYWGQTLGTNTDLRDLYFVFRDLDFFLQDLHFDLGSNGPAGDWGGGCALEMVGGREFDRCLSECVRLPGQPHAMVVGGAGLE